MIRTHGKDGPRYALANRGRVSQWTVRNLIYRGQLMPQHDGLLPEVAQSYVPRQAA